MTTATILDAAARLYGAQALTPLSGGHASLVYEFQREGKAAVLRITPPGIGIDLHSTRTRLHWLAYLAAQGGPVPQPLHSLDGNLIETVLDGDALYILHAEEKAPGVLAEGMLPEEWRPQLFEALGRAVGRCHRVAQGYQPAAAEARPDWQEMQSCFNPLPELPSASPVALAQWQACLARLADLPVDALHYGVTHLDLHFGNFFVDPAKNLITLFDFDNCARGWYVMDIAMLLFDVLVVYQGEEPLAFGERFLRHLLKGYLPENPALTCDWLARLPDFLKLVETGVYVMLEHTYQPETVDEWVAKFMPGRRERIENDLPYVNLDFARIHDQCMRELRAVPGG